MGLGTAVALWLWLKNQQLGKDELWKSVADVPGWAQKTIKGGRLNGMTDISPIGTATSMAIAEIKAVPRKTGTAPKAPVEPTWSGRMAV